VVFGVIILAYSAILYFSEMVKGMSNKLFLLFSLFFFMPEAVAYMRAHLDFPTMIDYADVIVEGSLSSTANSEIKKHNNSEDIIMFLVDRTYKGDENSQTILLCDSQGSFKKGGNTRYIVFLLKRFQDECYNAINLGPAIEFTDNEKIVTTGAIRNEPLKQAAWIFIEKIKTRVKLQQETWKKNREKMEKQRKKDREQRNTTNKGNESVSSSESSDTEFRPPSLSGMVGHSGLGLIAYGYLSPDSDIIWRNRKDDTDIVDFFVDRILFDKGHEKNSLIGLCNETIEGSPLDRIFRRSKEGRYIVFLMLGDCYAAYEIGSIIEVTDDGMVINTGPMRLEGEPERQPLQDFFKKINTEISKQKEKAGQTRMK
jgi:hypothetical protein